MSKIIFLIAHIVLYIYDIPLRLLGAKIGNDSYVGFGYSFFFGSKKGIEIGNGVSIGNGAIMQTVPSIKSPKPELVIGGNTNIGKDFFISSAKKIAIGKNCLISARVTILDHDHIFNKKDVPIIDQGITDGKPVEIGDNCFIGINSVITKGVTLGDYCVVGANSVVTKSFPNNSVIAGSPAVKIKNLELTK